jgi:cation transport ATPase
MTCKSCVNKIQKELKEKPGVNREEVGGSRMEEEFKCPVFSLCPFFVSQTLKKPASEN